MGFGGGRRRKKSARRSRSKPSRTKKPVAEEEENSLVTDICNKYLGQCFCEDYLANRNPPRHPEHEFDKCAIAIVSYRCSPGGFLSQQPHFLHLDNEKPPYDGFGEILRLDWVRINRIHKQKTTNPRERYYRRAFPEFYQHSRPSDTQLIPYPYGHPSLLQFQFGSMPRDFIERNRHFKIEHNNVFGRIFLIDVCEYDFENNACNLFCEGDRLERNVGPHDMLLLQGLSYPMSAGDCNICLNLETQCGDSGEVLQVARGVIEVYPEADMMAYNAYHVEEVVGMNGSVDVCYSIITSPLYIRLGAKAVIDPDDGCSHVFGSITAKELNHDGVEMYLFWADRGHPVVLSDDASLPFVRNSLGVKEGVEIIFSVDLYDCSKGDDDICIARGEIVFTPSFSYEASSQEGQQQDQSIPGIELFIALVNFYTCC